MDKQKAKIIELCQSRGITINPDSYFFHFEEFDNRYLVGMDGHLEIQKSMPCENSEVNDVENVSQVRQPRPVGQFTQWLVQMLGLWSGFYPSG